MNNKHLSWYEEISNNFIIASRAYFLQMAVKDQEKTESASYRLEGGWIGDFYESLQNVEVSKTNDRNKPITMQRKVDYTRQTIVKYSMKWKHND